MVVRQPGVHPRRRESFAAAATSSCTDRTCPPEARPPGPNPSLGHPGHARQRVRRRDPRRRRYDHLRGRLLLRRPRRRRCVGGRAARTWPSAGRASSSARRKPRAPRQTATTNVRVIVPRALPRLAAFLPTEEISWAKRAGCGSRCSESSSSFPILPRRKTGSCWPRAAGTRGSTRSIWNRPSGRRTTTRPTRSSAAPGSIPGAWTGRCWEIPPTSSSARTGRPPSS